VPTPGVPDASLSTLEASSDTAKANAADVITLSARLRDGYGIPVMGETVVFSVSPSGPTLTQPSSGTNSMGVAQATLMTSSSGTYTVTAVTSAGLTLTHSVTFTPAIASPTYSTVTGPASTVADGVAGATITVTLRDPENAPLGGMTPVISATDTGGTNTYTACSAGNSLGVSTCTLKSRKAEVPKG